MTTLRAAVLDVDGTLLDSNYHHTLAWGRAFATVDGGVPLWRIHRHIGMGGDRLVAAVAGDDLEARLGDQVRARWEKEYDSLMEETRLFAGARGLLVRLRRAGLMVALASSAIPRHAQHAFDLLDAGELADLTTTAGDADESKPHPQLVRMVLDDVGTAAACMIGDSTWDVHAASEAGIPTIGLCTGGYGHQELITAGAVCVYDDLLHLTSELDQALRLCERYLLRPPR
ncbi:MAG: HAD family hydrolase [Actinomycetota bacterium]|nr:HAD family hydrolase [Actinomycetota bacterium]